MNLEFERVAQTLNYVFDNSVEGDANSVLKAFDEFGEKLWIMTIGHFKGDMIVKEIKKHNPKVGVELGTYIGYSAVKFGQHFKERGDGHYYYVEYDPIMAAVATQVVKFAGLSDYVTILRGDLSKNISVLKQKYNVSTIDFFFIDHMKDLYTQDFELAEQSGLYNKNTLIIADNIKTPGAPEFLAFMEKNDKYKFELQDAKWMALDRECLDAILVANPV